MKYVVLALLVACGGPSDRPTTDGSNTGGDGNTNGDNCPDEAKSVYVVDQNDTLSRFDPPTKTFIDLGQLDCPASLAATPFSMAVDRTAIAWVLYSSGELFRVDTTNMLSCTKSTWSTQQGLLQFGMGFSTDAVGGSTDTLFIAGGTSPNQPSSQLATLSMTNFQAQPVGTVQGWPELTGTGNAELWGFFPDATAPRIAKLNKQTGAALQTFPLTIAGMPTAWAFAFWGGDFWVFLMKGSETSTTIYQYDATSGQQKFSMLAAGRTIVGAGVSTCAPVIL